MALFKKEKTKKPNYIFETEDEEFEYEDDFVDYSDLKINTGRIISVALTGGPCSGKTELIGFAAEELKKKNIPVFVINETATELLKSNIRFADDPVDFQIAVFQLQKKKEEVINDYVKKYISKNNLNYAVLLYDRTAIDGSVYVSETEWGKLTRHANLINRYSDTFIIQLQSASAVDKFSRDNNEERYEDADEALKLDKRIFDTYRKVNNFAYIAADSDFEIKKKQFERVFFSYIDEQIKDTE